ncbi:MAG TPA: hypothetical protein VNN80_32700 [Polyangiaceae bacterium]|jgi:hypothetical protein|nr:hypothetical protein [Polyangiaceae bacterium]
MSSPRSRSASAAPPRARRLTYQLTFLWGVGGVLFLFARALVRLAPMAWQPIADASLSPAQVLLYAAWVAFNAYSEGYRAFQKSFCPRVVGRAHLLASDPTLLRALLAPLYCLSLFHANRRGLTVAWVMLATIAGLVWLLRVTPQPWRGIIDGGVVVALAWGALVILILAVRTLRGAPPAAKLNLPGS